MSEPMCECKSQRGEKLYANWASWQDDKALFHDLPLEEKHSWIMAANGKNKPAIQEKDDEEPHTADSKLPIFVARVPNQKPKPKPRTKKATGTVEIKVEDSRDFAGH